MSVLRAPVRWLVWVAVFSASLHSCSSSSATLTLPSDPTHAAVEFGNFQDGGGLGKTASLRVYEATTDASRTRGLMGVRSLPEDVGMAFEWSEPTTSGFWMKDTLIPLSIAFVGSDERIVSIQDMTPCSADPCHVYRSPLPYLMAVEANAGWFAQRHIIVGDTARLESRLCSPNVPACFVTPSA